MNLIYIFSIFLSLKQHQTAGSKAYDSGKRQPRLLCNKERQIKAKRERETEGESDKSAV